MGKNPSRIWGSEAELAMALKRWDKEFSAAMKGRKFESYKLTKYNWKRFEGAKKIH